MVRPGIAVRTVRVSDAAAAADGDGVEDGDEDELEGRGRGWCRVLRAGVRCCVLWCERRASF